MLINNVEIKKGDCLCGCAKDILGYHYRLAFAFKVDAIQNQKVNCTFKGYYIDDGVASYHEGPAVISAEELIHMLYEDDIAIFSEEDYNKFVNTLKQEELDEEEYAMFHYFDEFWESAIAKFYERGHTFF